MRIVYRFLACVSACSIGCALAPAVNAAIVVPATTTKLTYDFTSSNTSIVTSGASSKYFNASSASDANGNALVINSTAPNISVTASAWNITSNVVAQSVLGQYVGGLGITAPSPYDDTTIGACGNGQCGTHQIDSQGQTAGSVSTDVIQLVFSQAVTLGSVTRNAYGLVTSYNSSTNSYAVAYDDDMSWGKGAGTGLAAGAQSTAEYNAMWTSTGSGFDNGACAVGNTAAAGGYKGCADTDATNTQASASNSAYASKVWYISAGAALASFSGQDNIADAFKLTGLSVYYYTPQVSYVPEPASWAMMIVGFGAVGSSIRRRRAAERAAAATA